MNRLSFVAWICTVLLFLSSVSSQKRRIKLSPSYVGGKYRRRPLSSVTRTGLSSRRMNVLFPTAAALGGIFIASRMRPHVRLRSYHDLDGYTVCEGYKTLTENRTIVTYKYFLCPDDLNQRFKRYCCTDEHGEGRCCAQDEKSGNILGSVAGVIIFLALIGTVFYCCCYRKRTSRKGPATTAAIVTPATGIPGVGPYGQDQISPGQLPAPAPPYADSYVPPYPGPHMPASKESTLPYPASDPFPAAQTPSSGFATGAPQPPAISSGWGAPAVTTPGTVGVDNTPGNEAPPPPYSVAVAMAPYPSR